MTAYLTACRGQSVTGQVTLWHERVKPPTHVPATKRGVPGARRAVVDEDRPAGGITAIFDSQPPAVWGANYALHVAPSPPTDPCSKSNRADIHEVALLTACLTAYPWQSVTRQASADVSHTSADASQLLRLLVIE